MSKNKLALLRYKTIDQCLCNRHRRWTLDDLVSAVSAALYEYEGIDSGVSLRTVQLDIQNMRSDKLGYSAPIVVVDKRYYTYEDRAYSIMKSNVSLQDLEKISEMVRTLNQFKGFSFFEDVADTVARLEDKIASKRNQTPSVIQFEKNDQLKGLAWLGTLQEAIKRQGVLDIRYQSFKAKAPALLTVSPYLLKEYRNRWFLLCRHGRSLNILALDRMHDISPNEAAAFCPADDFDVPSFFHDVIGVTKTLHQKTQRIILRATPSSAPYILTKPMHPSQAVLKHSDTELIFSLQVVPNYELEREVLGFGENLVVLAPKAFRQRIAERVKRIAQQYEA